MNKSVHNTELATVEELSEQLIKAERENKSLVKIIEGDNPVTTKVKAYVGIDSIKGSLLALLPPGKKSEQLLMTEVQSLLFDISQSSELQKCTPQSLILCLKETLSRGFRIGSSHKEAYPVKFDKKLSDNSWVSEAKIIPGYRAYINKAWSNSKTRLCVDTISKDEVKAGFIKTYDPINNILELSYKIGQETKVKTKENIEYVYVLAKFKDGSQQVKLFTKEEIEEKSKVKRGGKIVLGNVWSSKDRSTDYAEMLKKSALVAFCKTLPDQSLVELADFDYRVQDEVMKDVTPHNNNKALVDRFSDVVPEEPVNDVEPEEEPEEQKLTDDELWETKGKAFLEELKENPDGAQEKYYAEDGDALCAKLEEAGFLKLKNDIQKAAGIKE